MKASIGLALVVEIVALHSPRFSLRTMLIATTLVAVVPGMGVWLAR